MNEKNRRNQVIIIYRKNCHKCDRPSYSSSEIGKWICPVCGSDLTDFPFFNAITFERIRTDSIPLYMKLKKYK